MTEDVTKPAAGEKAAKTPSRPPLLVGEPVQYLPGGSKEYVPATVCRINDDNTVNLHVLRPEFNSPEWRDGVKEGKPGKRQDDTFRRLMDVA